MRAGGGGIGTRAGGGVGTTTVPATCRVGAETDVVAPEALTAAGGSAAAAWSRASRTASRRSATDWYRSASSLASAYCTTVISGAGMPDASVPPSGGGSWRCLKIVCNGVGAWNGTCPVKVSKSTMPIE